MLADVNYTATLSGCQWQQPKEAETQASQIIVVLLLCFLFPSGRHLLLMVHLLLDLNLGRQSILQFKIN